MCVFVLREFLWNIYKFLQKKVLAPLVGGSDLRYSERERIFLSSHYKPSYRLLARSFGAQVTFTEMCVADYYLRTMKGDRQKLKTYDADEFHKTNPSL